MRILNRPPNWICNRDDCFEMATTIFQLRPYCRQHMLALVGEMVPRNRAEQRSMAKSLGMSGGPNRRRKSATKRFKSTPYWHKALLEQLAKDVAADEAAKASDDEVAKPVGWVENEAGILAPA